ncbi:MAG TPA: DUF3618 domain-containing protein [Allosphingosinicella sp.]|jgi:hypothetical protein|nr:DUF3618 domain-containing protein [Allosphingosinicella sp.]
MSIADISIAKQEAERARRRLAATAAELQQRLKPGTLASNAWEGVKDKSGEMADGAVEAVRSRPVPVAAALTAFTLFLARAPLKAAVSRLFSGGDEDDEDRITVRLDGGDKDYDLTAPLAAGTSEGARE